MSVDKISRTICSSSRSPIPPDEGFFKKKKKNWVEKSDFLASLWWTGRVMDEGHVVLPGKGCGRGNDGAAGTCVWGSVSDCALLGKAGGHRDAGHLPQIPAAALATAPAWEGEAQRNHFPCVHSAPLAFSPALIFPFIPSLHPFLFSVC